MDSYVPAEWVLILLARCATARAVYAKRLRVIERARWRLVLQDISEDMPSDENHLWT